MNIASLLVGTLVGQIVLIVTKIVFIGYLNLDSNVIFWLFFVLLIVETVAIVRRMGILNLFEAVFLSFVWLIVSLLVDFVVTTSFVGRDVYGHIYFWFLYLVVFMAIMIFHKKAHIEARKTRQK